ncbi:MAG: polysaccharide pyruvyl transferase family protein [Clostridia bacterium]|nr:polysaccharide pyruvyl transferase family protein [Clostridia bacterium]
MVNVANIEKTLCTGCSACANKCPVNAIEMKTDKDGFLYPTIDEEKCVDCGACVRMCPVNKPLDKNKTPTVYAVWADEETRKKSSSGGLFSVLARAIFKDGGVVFGARYSDDFLSVYHAVATNERELAHLRGSKYVQSNIGMAYKEAKKHLETGKSVLFSGTPCQIGGLYSFLGKDYDNLYTVDVVCHGTPSQLAYSRYVSEKAQGMPIKKMDFREKASWGWGTAISLYMENGEYKKDFFTDPYLKAFSSGLIVRDSCSSCPYAQINRVGDITLGDFWGIKDIEPKYTDGHGTGLVLVNNKKGNELIKLAKKACVLFEAVDLDKVKEISKTRNGQLLAPVRKNPLKKRFFEFFVDKGLSFPVAYDKTPKYDVGYVGWWDSKNYGSALTSFAMNRTLTKKGLRVLMLEHGGIRPDAKSYGLEFASHFYNCSKITWEKDFKRFNGACESFLVGSDQLWNWWNIRHNRPEFFFLDFVEPGHKKIAYATSFGKDNTDFPDDRRLRVSYHLSKFDAISVREKSGVDVCKNEFGVEATHVLDPVFLCDMDSYKEVTDLSKLKENGKYVFSYILDPTEDKIEMVKQVAKRLGLPYRIAIDALRDNDAHSKGVTEKLLREDSNVLTKLRIEDWLNYIANASFVATDSFHGFCFSIIYNKQVIAYINPRRGKARFESIAETTGLENRLITESHQIGERGLLESAIDYSRVNEKLNLERERSMAWLDNALNKPIRKTSASELLLWKCLEHDKAIYESKLSEMQGALASLSQRIEELEKKNGN